MSIVHLLICKYEAINYVSGTCPGHRRVALCGVSRSNAPLVVTVDQTAASTTQVHRPDINGKWFCNTVHCSSFRIFGIAFLRVIC